MSATNLLYKMDVSYAPFRDSHPLAFNLYNQDGHYVLYIANDPGEASLTVDLRNTSTRTINLLSPNGKDASDKNYHFHLKFRPGVLSQASIDRYKTAQVGSGDIDTWSVLSQLDPTSEEVTLYLLYTANRPLIREGRLLLHLPLSAAASVGARGTQVEMLPNPQQVQYIPDPNANTPIQISGGQSAHLQIISHQGMRYIPLQVGFVGSNRVLNDGESLNSLILEIKNQLHRDDRGEGILKLIPWSESDNPTKFILSFDYSDSDTSDDPWALTKKANSIKLSLTPAKDGKGNPLPFPNHDDGKWMITPNSPETDQWEITPKIIKQLDPADAADLNSAITNLKLYIDEIMTDKPSGLTNLYLRYKRIPGYWDGEFVCPIEKAPLVFGKNTDSKQYKNNVGIGTTADQTRYQLTLGDKDHSYVGLQQDKGQLVFWVNGTPSYKGREGLRINASGNIGIGTNDPGAKLHVMADLPATSTGAVCLMVGDVTKDAHLRISYTSSLNFIQSDCVVDKVAYRAPLLLNPNGGQVGIGTTTPKAKLSINGGVHIGGDADPGDKNLQVDGELIVGGNLEAGSFQPGDKYLTLKVAGGNEYRSGIKFWAWEEDYGYSIQHDERYTPRPGLRIKAHNKNADGITLMFFDWTNTNIGIGTDDPQAKLHIMDQPQDAEHGTLILGPTSEANLRLGYHTDYSWIQSHGAKPLAINPLGNKVGIGTSNPTLGELHVVGDIYCSGNIYAQGRLKYFWEQSNENKWKEIQNLTNEYAGSYDTTGPSDVRLKTALAPIGDALNKVLQLRGLTFRWNTLGLQFFTRHIESTISAGPNASEAENQKVWQAERERQYQELAVPNIGVVAQDVETVLPEAVAPGDEGYKIVNYRALIPLLIEAIKEQQNIVTALTTRMTALEKVIYER